MGKPVPTTALGAAFERAGFDTVKNALYVRATEALRAADMQPKRALSAFIREVEKGIGADMVIAIVGRPTFEARALAFLSATAADMAPKRAPGQRLGAAVSGQTSIARRTNDDGAGHELIAQRAIDHAPAPSSPPSSGSGQMAHAAISGQSRTARLAGRLPGHTRRGASVIAAMQPVLARSLHDTFLVDGSPIGDFSFGLARRLARQKGVEHRVLAQVVRHTQAPDSMSIREAISEETLRRFIIQAEENTDVF